MANHLETAALNALSDLLSATDHYGFSTPQSQSFWESHETEAIENGLTSDDIRSKVWERAYRALLAATEPVK